MGQLYILKLRGGRWYVGYTDKAINRILQHAEKKGAKWTKKHPPVNPIPYWMSEPGYTKEDENRKTLELMGKYGIEKVRGGDWCMVSMRQKTISDLERKIGKPKSGRYCERCGRTGHTRSKCYATTTVDGVAITTNNWKYRPKTKSKSKPKPKAKAKPRSKSHRCKAKTVYGMGPRCKLTAGPDSDYCRVHAPYYPKKRTRRR